MVTRRCFVVVSYYQQKGKEMRTYIKVPIQTEVPEKIQCNRCGIMIDCTQDNIEWFMTHYIQPFEIVFGFGSDLDGETWKFDLCNKCITEITNTFIVPVKIENYL
jgi:hypothetical protein